MRCPLTRIARSPTQTLPPGWFFALITYTPPGPMSMWSMSASLAPTGTECRTCQPCPVSRSNRVPTAPSPLAPTLKARSSVFASVTRQRRVPSRERCCISARSSSAFSRTAWPGLFRATSVQGSSTGAAGWAGSAASIARRSAAAGIGAGAGGARCGATICSNWTARSRRSRVVLPVSRSSQPTPFAVCGVHVEAVLAVPSPPAGDESPAAYWISHLPYIGHGPLLP